MNLLCPSCQNRLSVPEQNAGQLMKCPFCSKYFSVPALPQAAMANAGPVAPSKVTSQAPSETPSSTPSPSPSLQPDVFTLAREPAAPQTLPPRPNEPVETRPAPVPQQPAEQTSPPPPTGYERTLTLWISPRVVPWIAPVALFLVLILMFFPWTGVRPGGYVIYTQSALQMIWGGYSVDDPDGEQVLQMKDAIDAAIRANWLMVFYLLLILAALVLAVAPHVQARLAYPLPRIIQELLQWRTLLVLIATLLAFFILLRFLLSYSGFEDAVLAAGDRSWEKASATPTHEKQIKHAIELSRLNLSRTFWLRGSVLFHIVALAGAGLELWLQRRGARSLPRLEVHW